MIIQHVLINNMVLYVTKFTAFYYSNLNFLSSKIMIPTPQDRLPSANSTDKPQEEVKIMVHFTADNRLSYSENNATYTMVKNKGDENKSYFNCINKFLVSSNPRKCTATGHYNAENKVYTPKQPHTLYCGKTSEFCASDSYEVQKNLIIEELNRNQRLTPAPALELLTNENHKRPPEQKFLPISYEQCKYIIQSWKNDNGIRDERESNDCLVLTRDNSLFLRYNSSFYTIHQSNYY